MVRCEKCFDCGKSLTIGQDGLGNWFCENGVWDGVRQGGDDVWYCCECYPKREPPTPKAPDYAAAEMTLKSTAAHITNLLARMVAVEDIICKHHPQYDCKLPQWCKDGIAWVAKEAAKHALEVDASLEFNRQCRVASDGLELSHCESSNVSVDTALAPDYHAPRGCCGSCKFSFVPEDGDDAPSFCRSDQRGGYRVLPFIKVFGEDEEGSCLDWDAVDGWKDTALGAEPKKVLESEPPQSILTYGSCPICGGRVMCSKGSPLSESHLISINGRWVRFCEGCGDAIIECNIEVKP